MIGAAPILEKISPSLFYDRETPMVFPKPVTRRHFTEAARIAAAAARKRKREMRVARDSLELFVVRESDLSTGFSWEIRRFGGIVLDRSGSSFSRVREARSAGEAALSGFEARAR